MLGIDPNPLFVARDDPAVRLESIDTALTYTRQKRHISRDIRDLRKKQSAQDALAGFTQTVEIFGLSKGQFSLIDLIDATLHYTGPVALSVSTWTAAHTDLTAILDFLQQGRITSTRWLVDFSFARRAPELVHKLRLLFQHDAIRVTKNHAKFCLMGNTDWHVVLRTSMNLNTNPRFEDFTLAHDPGLFAFLSGVLDSIWGKQEKGMANQPSRVMSKHFREDL
jgi:hypothetical protein